ncbi:MAG: peptidoglycan -binding protein [Paracoccaceae bacterium]|nr:peptidoglycan -binding protein [Paracoccaceae bacterium]
MALSRRTGQRFQASIWPGFVDAMTGLLLVLMFVLTIFMVVQFVLRETISGQESELDLLSAEITAISEALGLEREKVISLESNLGTLTTTLDTTQSELSKQALRIAQLTGQRDDAMASLDSANSRILSFEDKVAGLLSSQTKAKAIIASLETEKTNLLSKQEAVNLALATARTEIDQAAEEARRKAAERQALESLIATLNGERDESKALIVQQTADLQKLEDVLSEKEAARLVSSAAAEALRKKLEDADSELTSMTLALEEQRRKAEETLIILAAAEAAKSDFEEILRDTVFALEAANAKLQVQGDEINNLQAKAKNAASEFDKSEFALAAALARQINLETRINELEDQLVTSLRSGGNKEVELGVLRQSLSNVQSEIGLLERIRLTDEERLAELQAELSEALLNFEQIRLDQGETKKSKQDLQSSLSQTERDLLAIQKRSVEQERLTASLEQKITFLLAELDQKDRRLKAQVARQALLKGQLEVVKNALDAQQSVNATSNQITQTVKEQLAEALLNLSRTQEDREKANLKILTLREQLEKIENSTLTDKRSIESKLAAALAAITAAKDKSEQVQEQLKQALAAKLMAENQSVVRLDEAIEKELLRAQAMELLKDKESELKKSVQQTLRLEKQTTVLNAQLAQLRNQMGQLQALLEVSEQKDIDSKVMLQNMGSRLNAALARAVAEERKTRKLEEAERKRLEDEKARLEKEQRRLEEEKKALSQTTEDLEKYKSDFFGRLREVLSKREGVRVVGDRFVFSSEVLFAAGQAKLSTDGQKEITKVGRILTEIMSEIPKNIDWIIRVDGHTDSTPIKNSEFFDDNWDLSQARALSVVRFMISELEIPPQRLAANGFGEFQPINSDITFEAKAQNRRIELKLTER